MNIEKMDQAELSELAVELKSWECETYEESAKRFRDDGDEETARLFLRMADRWFALED